MIWPLDSFRETQWFNNPPGHGGLDMAAPCGTEIKSPVAGTVIADGEDAGYIGGKYVIVRESDPRGYEFYMGHMSSNSVVRGQKVKEGEVIGVVGKTGKATGCHVHFQIRRKRRSDGKAGALFDPKSLKFGSSATIDDMTNREAHDLGVQLYRKIFRREPESSKVAQNLARSLANSKEQLTPTSVKSGLVKIGDTSEFKSKKLVSKNVANITLDKFKQLAKSAIDNIKGA